VIFSFSAKKADESTVMSHSVGKLIGNIVIPEYRSWPEDKQEQFAEKIYQTGNGKSEFRGL
jgi:hypothetical protein